MRVGQCATMPYAHHLILEQPLAELLNDREIRQVLGSVIQDGDESSIRSNSYVLRLGAHGEFLTTGKEFALGDAPNSKKGIRVPPGQSVALTSYETIDFRRETVHKHFPEHDLHAFISPATDLQREGVVAPSTQIDAGYMGTLNWTISNSSSEERRFVHQERLFRLTILKLGSGETPEALYAGEYQGKTGYVRSRRAGPPVGMRDVDWEDSTTTEGPQALLERLIKSGFPWTVLGERLQKIDNQFQVVTNEYADIRDAMQALERETGAINKAQAGLTEQIRNVVRDEFPAMHAQGLVRSGSLVAAAIGIGLSIWSLDALRSFILEYAWQIGLALVVAASAALWRLRPRRRSSGSNGSSDENQ